MGRAESPSWRRKRFMTKETTAFRLTRLKALPQTKASGTVLGYASDPHRETGAALGCPRFSYAHTNTCSAAKQPTSVGSGGHELACGRETVPRNVATDSTPRSGGRFPCRVLA